MSKIAYFNLPDVGEGLTEAEIVSWKVKPGDAVKVNQVIVEIETAKSLVELPCPFEGVISELMAAEGDTVEVGKPLISATVADGAVGATVTDAEVSASAHQIVADVAATAAAAEERTPNLVGYGVADPNGPIRRKRASAPLTTNTSAITAIPAAAVPAPAGHLAVPTHPETQVLAKPPIRKLAKDLGVNLANVKGTGVGGRIRKEDVEALARPAAPAPVATSSVAPTSAPKAPVAASPLRGTTFPMSRLRKVIAARMVESLQVSAQLTTVVEVDVTKIARLRDKAKANFEAREGVKLSFLPFFAVAVCEALKQHPVVNASIDGENIVYHGAEHLGVAVDTERGLLVPVIHNAGDLNMGGIARKISDLAARTRDNKVTPDELGGGTFTLTNTGSRGALFDTPIINQPQVAILGLGSVVKRPMVVKGADGGETIAIRSMVYLALSYDHRIVDGADAARFLVTLKDRLETGNFESDLGI